MIDSKRDQKKIFYKFWGRIVVLLITWIAIIFIGIFDQDFGTWQKSYKVGQPAEKDIYSPYSFSYVNKTETEIKKKFEQSQVNDIYQIEKNFEILLEQKLTALRGFCENYHAQETPQAVPIGAGEFTEFDPAILTKLFALEDYDAVLNALGKAIQAYYASGIIAVDNKKDLLRRGKKFITISNEADARELQVNALTSLDEEWPKIETLSKDLYPRSQVKQEIFLHLFKGLVTPNLVYDAELTEKRKQAAYENAQPVYDRVVKGEIILRKGQLILEGDLAKLQEIRKLRTKTEIITTVLGIGLISLLVLIMLITMLALLEPNLFVSRKNLVLVCLVIVLTFLICKVFSGFEGFPITLLPVALAAILVSILFNPRVGFVVAICQPLLVGSIMQYHILIILMGTVAGVIGLYPTINIRKRSQFFQISLYVGLINFLMAFSFYVYSGFGIEEAFQVAVYGIFNAIIIILLLPVLIPIFERYFDLTTDLTLLELSDLNHPLLRRLVIEAPGTYHHTLVVSNLCESACEAIGANALLGRVGCYFHDIGKLLKSDYFTENQGGKNIHDDLSPSMSCLIIINHVKEGIELAKKHKLKKSIIDFIPQHQGTGVIRYFYHKALEQAENKEDVNPDDYRYPGPKPQTKETGIAMIADSVEAASRSLDNPTATNLDTLVGKIINDKFMDHQLDECDLTFNDLRKIKESFVRNLIAIYHTRVKYPEVNSSDSADKLM